MMPATEKSIIMFGVYIVLLGFLIPIVVPASVFNNKATILSVILSP